MLDWYNAYKLLRDHTAHADADKMQASIFSPANVIKHLDNILCHL